MKKTALITGGSRGIGAACVEKFAGEGFDVAFLYEKNDDAAAMISGKTGALPLKCDVSDYDALTKAAKGARTYFGATAFDVLVCAAGITGDGLITDVSEEDIRRVMDVNFHGTVNAVRAVIPEMIRAEAGSVITVSSVWGQTGAAAESIYAASKGAVIALTKSLAKELGPTGIRVNCVSPGVIDTDMNGGHSEETMRRLADETPLCRIGKPEEVAEAVYYLSTEAAAFVTGQVIPVNGGFYI